MRAVIFAVLLAWACIGAGRAQDATPAPTAASGSTPDPVLAHRPAAATSISPKINVIYSHRSERHADAGCAR